MSLELCAKENAEWERVKQTQDTLAYVKQGFIVEVI